MPSVWSRTYQDANVNALTCGAPLGAVLHESQFKVLFSSTRESFSKLFLYSSGGGAVRVGYQRGGGPRGAPIAVCCSPQSTAVMRFPARRCVASRSMLSRQPGATGVAAVGQAEPSTNYRHGSYPHFTNTQIVKIGSRGPNAFFFFGEKSHIKPSGGARAHAHL